MTKKRARVRKRRASRRPTRVVTPKLSEGGRAFRYFVPEKKHGDDRESGGRPTLPKRVAPSRGMHGLAGSSPAITVYYEPPPRPKPFWSWSNEEIFAWLDRQDPGYQETARQMAALADMDVASNERRRSVSPCSECGYDGTPNGMHRWTCPVGTITAPPPRYARAPVPIFQGDDNDDDDDIPF